VFAANCVGCHSATNPGGAAGGYDLSSYLGVLGLSVPLDPNVAPSSVAVAGNPSSRLVQILQSPTDPIHAQFSSLAPVVAQWVGQCNLAFFNSAIHSSGILNPSDPGFHGKLLQANGWNYGLCSSCHGADFSGGAAGVACTACHTSPGGPTSCNTCHGLPPAEGAHFTHVNGGLGLDKPWSCTECHVMPTGTDAGHLLLDDAGFPIDDTGMLFDADGGLNTGPPSVVFGPFAETSAYWTPGYNPASPPTFDPTTQTCSNVYCHGDTLGDTKATNTRPHWNEPGTGQAACGTCHGLPPSNHGSDFTQCSNCHGLVVDADQNFIDPTRHIDGVLWLGNGDGTCSACHGSATSPAPPNDLEGNTATTAIGVGAHQAHLQAHHLRGPIACGDCHLVPQNPGSPGHIDHNLPATVFPATTASTSLAFADDAGPVENHATATCSNVYCHGGGAQMQSDKSPSLHRQPVWTDVSAGEIACGTCHGIPPQDGNPGHGIGAGLETCASCHWAYLSDGGTIATVGPSGIIITVLPDGGLTSLHIDGVIEVDGGIWSGN
jgi:predicted CxxxxCH...CXXCH cytochrome family protein